MQKRIVEDKENRTRPAEKKVVKPRKTSNTLTAMYGDETEESTSLLSETVSELDDELDELVPKKQQRKPSKPKGMIHLI